MITTSSGNGFADVGRPRTTAECPYVDTEESASRQVDPTLRLNWTENVGSMCHRESDVRAPEVVGRRLKGAKAAKVWRRCYRIDSIFA